MYKGACGEIRGQIYLAADVERWLGSGAGWVGGEIEEATRLASKGKKRYTLAINTNIDLDRWAIGSDVIVFAMISILKSELYDDTSSRYAMHPAGLLS